MARPDSLGGYILAAERRITEYLTEELAAVRPELVAQLSEYYFESTSERFNIDPHVANPAIARMLRAGRIVTALEPTRGGRRVETFCLAPDPFQSLSEAQKRAAARKRLLYARYLSWASGSRSRPGTAGPAAETAVRAALTGVQGLALLAPGFGSVTNVFGVLLPGPLDSAATVTMDPTQLSVISPIEVKNVRYWLYPNSEEPWQLIWKALALSAAEPSWKIAPVLICRRAHATLFWMARDLGVLVREMRVSPMGDVDPAHLQEVVKGLGFSDLRVGAEPPKSLRPWIQDTLTQQAYRSATVWAETVADETCRVLLEELAATRTSDDRDNRTRLLTLLNIRCRALGRQGWQTKARHSSR